MKRLTKLMAITLTVFAITSCSEDLLDNFTASEPTSSEVIDPAGEVSPYCGSQTWTLWAGQHMDYGTLTVANDETNLYVTYTATTGTFGTLHLWVGTDMSLLPKNNQGTPIPGHFPYVFDASGLTTYTFVIPLANISFFAGCDNTKFYVVAHAEMGGETAFGGDIAGTGTNRWYYYAEYNVVCCQTPPPPPSYDKLGTAFAKGGYVFTTDKKSNPENLPSLKLTRNRWGWAINIKEIGYTYYELWVGAGLNYTSKGMLVGGVSIEYNGSQAIVTYNLDPGYAIEEAHIYAGDFKPTTLAPGQYGNTAYFDPFVSSYSLTVDVSDSNGDGVWFIVHAVAYGSGVSNVN